MKNLTLPGDPDPSVLKMNQLTVEHTMLRFQAHIRSAVSANAVLNEAGGKHVITGVEHLLYYLNGDWRMQRLQTHRIAQVAGEAGEENVRKATCEQVFDALTGTSCLFGGLNTIPAKSRWGTWSKGIRNSYMQHLSPQLSGCRTQCA